MGKLIVTSIKEMQPMIGIPLPLLIISLSFFLLLTGCSYGYNHEKTEYNRTYQTDTSVSRTNPSISEIKNKDVPELSGGAEFQNRTGQHSSQLPNIVFYEGPSDSKVAALTFDDGPDIHYTTEILKILSQNNIKATFFIVGQRAQAHPEMVTRIAQEGHAIGNHSWDHPDLVKLTPEKIKIEIEKTDQILNFILGYHPRIFRPPYGAASKNDVNIITTMGYKIIDWSVDTRDWAGTSPATIMSYFHREFKPGGIILQHCAGGKDERLDNTIVALRDIISELNSQGFSFVTIPQLLNIPR